MDGIHLPFRRTLCEQRLNEELRESDHTFENHILNTFIQNKTSIVINDVDIPVESTGQEVRGYVEVIVGIVWCCGGIKRPTIT